METISISAKVIQQLGYIADDDNSMKKVLDYINMLIAQKDEKPIMTKAEIVSDLKEAFKELKQQREGKTKFRPAEELINEL